MFYQPHKLFEFGKKTIEGTADVVIMIVIFNIYRYCILVYRIISI